MGVKIKSNRFDLNELRERILPFCRLKYGEIWEDPVRGHKVGVLDACRMEDVKKIFKRKRAKLVVNDPPYNIKISGKLSKQLLENYLAFSELWIESAIEIMESNAHLYIWLGTDYRDGFQPLPDFMIIMRDFEELEPRNFITMRNQRGYGTQKNWMWVRQELLHYTKGNPEFNVVYTNIPKKLGGYYKKVGGAIKENIERSKSKYIRPGNVWMDIQQVFYRMKENVPGCYTQKPLKAIERIILSSSSPEDLIADFFAHSGTTLIAGEMCNRRVYTFDIDPIFAEVAIRRLERFRQIAKIGWQRESPFPELDKNKGDIE